MLPVLISPSCRFPQSIGCGMGPTLHGRAFALFGLACVWGSNDPRGWWNIYTETHLYRDCGDSRAGTCPKIR